MSRMRWRLAFQGRVIIPWGGRRVKGRSSYMLSLNPLALMDMQLARNLQFTPRFTENEAGLAVLFIYALTRICSMGYIKGMESVFEIIAEPNRRAILSLLVSSQQSVGEIERQLRMPQPTVSKHLRVLRDAGFVESTVDAQRRLYRLTPEPLQELDAWLAQFRRFWSAHVDALERHLDRMKDDRIQRPHGSSTLTKKKTTRPNARA